MSDVNDQASRLALADKRIADARRRITVEAERVERLRKQARHSISAEQFLQIMHEVLDKF
jgi:hypothetical protein